MYVVRFTRPDLEGSEGVTFSVVKHEHDQNPEVFYTRSNKLSIFDFDEMTRHVKGVVETFPDANVLVNELR